MYLHTKMWLNECQIFQTRCVKVRCRRAAAAQGGLRTKSVKVLEKFSVRFSLETTSLVTRHGRAFQMFPFTEKIVMFAGCFVHVVLIRWQ